MSATQQNNNEASTTADKSVPVDKSWSQIRCEELQDWYERARAGREAYKAHADKLAEALREIFKQCACVHKYWGEGCNQREADAAVTLANEALAAYEADERRQDALEIDVILEGGVIQEMIGIPAGARVRVIDYDTEGADPADLSESPYDQDNKCFLGVYTGTPTGYRFSRDATLA